MDTDDAEVEDAAAADGELQGSLPPSPARSLLSRQGSLGSMLRTQEAAAPARGGLRLSFLQQATTWFTATMLLGVIGVMALVVLAFPLPPQGAAPACRLGAAIAVVPAGANTSQFMVVWSGMGQDGFIFHDVHTLR